MKQKEQLQRTSTIQGVRGWIKPFGMVFTAYCCGIFVSASFEFCIIGYLLGDRGFKCCLLNVVNVVWSYLYVSP